MVGGRVELDVRKTAPTGQISRVLQQWAGGDLQAPEGVIPLVYQELRKRAAAYLRREREPTVELVAQRGGASKSRLVSASHALRPM